MDNVEETNGLPNGLCKKPGKHEPHSVLSDFLVEWWCTGDPPTKPDLTGTPAPQHDVRNF